MTLAQGNACKRLSLAICNINNKSPMKNNPVIRILLASLFAAGAASAVPIAGSINISSFNDPAFSFNTGTNQVSFGAGNNAIVTNRSGSYPLAMLTNTVHYNNFNYTGTPGPLVASPLWFTTAPNLGLASFNLANISFVDENPGISLTLRGEGIAQLAGFDNTPGTWRFTATQNGATFGWDSINTSARVPDGGATLALLGLSVLGLGGVRRFLPSLKK